MKKKIFKSLAVVACALLLVVGSVVGTFAYLTSTDAVTNTFTVGNVKITMDEAPVDANGEATTGDRVKANSYKLLPGHEYDKDPTIHVDDASESCWLFVRITDELAAIQDVKTVATQLGENGWTLIDAATNVYAHESIAIAGADVVVFETIKIKGDVDNATLAAYADKKVTVVAFAIQADGFDTAAEAWEAAVEAGDIA